MLRVLKFGGSSVGNAEAMKGVGKIIKQHKNIGWGVVPVLSAMMSVTNKLEAAAKASEKGDMKAAMAARDLMWNMHATAATELDMGAARRNFVLERLENSFEKVLLPSLNEVAQAQNLSVEKKDFILSMGERWSTIMMAEYLSSIDVPSDAIMSENIVITDSVSGGATPDMAESTIRIEAFLRPLLDQNIVPCVTGFMGADIAGKLTTMGRGGSDLTASVIGAALDCDEVVLFKVESKANPDGTLAHWKPGWIGIAPSEHAKTIDLMTYDQASKVLKVLHPQTCYPLIGKEIPLRVANTLEYLNPGTLITKHMVSEAPKHVRAMQSSVLWMQQAFASPQFAAPRFARASSTSSQSNPQDKIV